MLVSSAANSITFKDLASGNFPAKWNTLHADRKQAGKFVRPFCQLYPKDHPAKLQFMSDDPTLPDLNFFIPFLNDTLAGTLVSSYLGVNNRYFFNFEFPLGADYYDKKVYFTCVQGGDTLTSEPIFVRDISEDIQQGFLKYVKYSNLDRNQSDLTHRFIDWSVISYMDFYVPCVNYKPNTSDEVEILEGVQSRTIVSAVLYDGNLLETGPIPDYMSTKLASVADMDVFTVNGDQFIKTGEISEESFGNSTSIQATLNLTFKNVIGLNVDDLGIVQTDTPEMNIIPKRNVAVIGGGWEVDTPEGYMLHSIWITHAVTSVAAVAVVTCGDTPAGTNIIDAVQGSIAKATYVIGTKWKPFSRHHLENPDASTKIYFSVAGAGAVMQIIVNFETVTPES